MKNLINKLQKILDTEYSGRNLIESLRVIQVNLQTNEYGRYSTNKSLQNIYNDLDGICLDGQPADFEDDGDEYTMCDELSSLIKKLKNGLNKNLIFK